MRPLLLLPLFALAVGCSTTTDGAHPHDQSVAGHDRAAADEQAAARAHGAQYDPNGAGPTGGCQSGRAANAYDVCWSSTANPTEAHQISQERHRKAAAEHRAASQALRDAEATACTGISAEDRDMSPFAHREDILSVEPLQEATGSAIASTPLTTGATVTVRAVRGLTTEWLQRIVDCHLARASSLGHAMPEMTYCPLVPKGVSARVTSSGSAFAVAIRSDDPAAAAEVLRRSQQLVSR